MLLTLAVGLLPFAGHVDAPAALQPQNLCVIVLDDVGAGFVGAYDDYFQSIGRPSATPARTPAIDALLAHQGLAFTNAWAHPMCTPARAAMLTGRAGFRTGQGAVIRARQANFNPGLEPDVVLLPELLHLAPAPYACVALGKWHLASQSQIAAFPAHPLGIPAGRWFDRFAGTYFNLEWPPGSPLEQSGYYVWPKLFASALHEGLDPCEAGMPPCEVWMDANVSVEDYPSVDTIDDAIDMVHELAEPWFLYVAPHAVHNPLHDVPAGLPAHGCSGYDPIGPICDYPGMSLAAARSRCMLQALDAQIGRLLCEMDFQHTTVILVGDNGNANRAVLPPYSKQHAKSTVYQGGVEVPFIVRSPLIDPVLRGSFNDEALVACSDIFATALELAGVPPPAQELDSVSIVPYFEGRSGSLRATVYTEIFQPNFIPDPVTGEPPSGYVSNRHDQALRDGRFKLVRTWRRSHGAGEPLLTEQLFDLVSGGPASGSSGSAGPLPDWLEENDLLAAGGGLPLATQAALDQLRYELDTRHPTLVR